MDIFIQQLVNGLTLGSVYAIVALGYTMVYGIIQLINFAHGEVVMIGAMVSLTVINALLGANLGLPPLAVVVAGALAAIPVCMAVGYALERVAYRPLRRAPRLAPLITAIGLSIVLQHVALMIFSRNPLVYPQIVDIVSYHVTSNPDGARITNVQIAIIAISVAMMGGLLLLIYRTKLGIAMRATAQSQQIAGLMGIDINLVIAVTFAIGAGLAAVAGAMVGTYYGIAQYQMGFLLGLKAFSAAVLGGLPVEYIVETTAKCNIYCPMCPRETHKQPKEDMTDEIFTRLVRESGRSAEHMMLIGLGEPFMDPKIFERIEFCHRHSVSTLLSTNGTFLDEKVSARVLDSPLEQITLSFDGASKESFEFYRKGAKFEKVRDNFVRFARMKKELVEKGRKDIPFIFQYRTVAAENSLYNTPPTFGIYMLRNVLDWLKEQGGLAAMAERNREKAQLLYDVLDERADFYQCRVEKSSRSLMNRARAVRKSRSTRVVLVGTAPSSSHGFAYVRLSITSCRVSLSTSDGDGGFNCVTRRFASSMYLGRRRRAKTARHRSARAGRNRSR